MNLAIWILAAVAGLEAGAALLVRWLRMGCQWLIVPSDLTPPIDEDGLNRFLDHGWDAELGWIRKPNTSQEEKAKGGGRCGYHIGSLGERQNPGFESRPPGLLVYGDSYAFARQVNDDETWTHQLSLLLDVNGVNKGVGNYGLDQALLRLEREFDDHPTPLVVMAVVPETMTRVLGCWRHFSEYGNTFALKPRFALDGGELKLIANPGCSPEKFHAIPAMLPKLKENDELFERKFRPDILRFPYLFHIWRSRRRTLPLMAAALADRCGGDGKRAFCRVMERNINLNAALYREQASVDLMVAIVERFAAFSRSKSATPVFVMLPQIQDLAHLRRGSHYYLPFLERITDTLTTIDFGPLFAAEQDDGTNYIDDRFGGHFSVKGNRMVAERLAETLRPILEKEEPAMLAGETGS